MRDLKTLELCLSLPKKAIAKEILEIFSVKENSIYEIKLRDDIFEVGIKGKYTSVYRSRNFPYHQLTKVIAAINNDSYLEDFGIKTEGIS